MYAVGTEYALAMLDYVQEVGNAFHLVHELMQIFCTVVIEEILNVQTCKVKYVRDSK